MCIGWFDNESYWNNTTENTPSYDMKCANNIWGVSITNKCDSGKQYCSELWNSNKSTIPRTLKWKISIAIGYEMVSDFETYLWECCRLCRVLLPLRLLVVFFTNMENVIVIWIVLTFGLYSLWIFFVFLLVF